MTSIQQCCVPGCRGNGETVRPLHCFPKPELDRERFNTWLYAIGGNILGLDSEIIFKYRRVCRKHFETKFLCRYRRLSNIAVPTLNMPDPRSFPNNNSVVRKSMQAVENIELETPKPIDPVSANIDLPFAKIKSPEISSTEPNPTRSTTPDDAGNLDAVTDDAEEVPTTSLLDQSLYTPNSEQQSSTSTDEDGFETQRYEYLLEPESDGDDIDLDLEDIVRDAFPLPTLTVHDARNQPLCAADLSFFHSQVLKVEDCRNDIVIRNLAADDYLTFDWKDVSTFTGKRETFIGTSGPTISVTEQTTVLDIFDRMFDDDFIDDICIETNRYANQKIALLRQQDKLTSNARLFGWKPTNRDEMISYLALTILQGLYPQIDEESYFCFNGFGTMPYFSRIMSYNRFTMLKSVIHFVDNETLTDRSNKLWKIKPVIEYFNNKFSSIYKPSQEISIDETLLEWNGRLSFAQKIAAKAANVGIKTYELCESSSGYIWKFFVSIGKNLQIMTQTADASNQPDPFDKIDDSGDDETVNVNDSFAGSDDGPINATAKIIYDLLEPLLYLGHTVIIDNFYTSPLLLRCLKRQKTDCYGTLRLNREFVPDSIKTLKKTDLRQGEAMATYCADLAIMVWRDANLVSMISTYHQLQIGIQQKYNRVVYKPQVVLDYYKSMGGVDRKYQYLSAPPIERVRYRVRYKKLFQRLFSTAIYNCFVIFQTQNPNISHRKFQITLAEKLLLRHRQIDLTREPSLTLNRETGQNNQRNLFDSTNS